VIKGLSRWGRSISLALLGNNPFDDCQKIAVHTLLLLREMVAGQNMYLAAKI
jgi:hypothetical protein